MIGYPVQIVEYDRWSGSKCDGFIVFDSNARRAQFITEEYKNRNNSVPEYYVNYELLSVIELDEQAQQRLLQAKEGRYYAKEI